MTSAIVDQDITGTSVLPISKVKKIIRIDDDIVQCSSNSAFLIAIATEMFIQYMVQQGLLMCLNENKKTLQYRHLANAVSRLDNLEFLSVEDTIPKTIAFKDIPSKTSKAPAKNTESDKL
ncbi:hypothetical protein MERGE_000401 [Pneumocystis wakefieldiae]|uniref:Transcription factor CBF/NF-Y/archaeal histone domain-containing protein n=1 Tax=Pneumocystis wakefieldiae TaxID=38082 RepID=A0A899FVC9_9ASCO|nr:hypothetical protein MERGE_000401 [Pneumocystis wakefieldiae]